ncbi:hypothetical protein BV20DRAFT_945141 [Pilatotrama ljubarskyi]|nr:hypothetical protein BV20DRAFT_945141 [Pilatotrama ljubarskyi]
MLSESFESRHAEGAERGSANASDATASSSFASRSSNLLPAFGVQKMSHLPTPQSPSNLAQYAPELNGSFSSPVSNINREAPLPHASASRAETPLSREEVPSAPVASFMTPESSPLFPRKMMPPLPVTPVAGPSSMPHTPQRNEPGPSDASTGSNMVVDTAVPPLAPAPIITTPVSSSQSRGITPASRLSSPFRDKSADLRATTSKSESRSPMPPNPDFNPDADSPMALDVFSALPRSSLVSGSVTSPPLVPLASPVPQRALGGEIHRIHLQLAADRAERLHENEARRPDYLVREKRPHPGADGDADIPTLDELDAAHATLGVTETPLKGRRLQLFQATSEETFEQSLLAGGYPGYGQSPSYKVPEPQTPVAKAGRSGLSQRALQWLQQATPGQPGPSTVAAIEEPLVEEAEGVPSEREIKKRRRLDMFRQNAERKASGSKLYPVEIEGRGRLLLNVPPEGTPAQPETPVKRRTVRKKKRRGGGKRSAVNGRDDEDAEPLEPNWPDAAFPWCMRAQERAELAKMEQEERLRWIERFLDRDSESDEEEEDQMLRPPLQSHENDQAAHRRGRGKMVPLRANPTTDTHAHDENVLLPSDPADARAALLSKRSVRALAFRRASGGGSSPDSEEVICIGCRRGDDGSELVQCDECQTWYHLRCIGIATIAELGKEEDPWYCDRCLDIRPSSPLTEPTFVPTDDRPIESAAARRDSLFLQNPSLLESPAPHWETEPRAPQTPVRGSAAGSGGGSGSSGDRTFSTHSSWGGSSSRAGPSTPDSSAKTVRVYHTPGPFAFERDQLDPETPFDPTTTPSRGIKFSGGPPPTLGLSTPRGGFGLWAGRGGHTPTPAAKFGSGGPWRHGAWGEDSGGGVGAGGGVGPFGSPHARSIYSVGYDDTPVTRAPRLGERGAGTVGVGVQGRRLWDSPGFARPLTPSPPLRAKAEVGDETMETEGA